MSSDHSTVKLYFKLKKKNQPSHWKLLKKDFHCVFQKPYISLLPRNSKFYFFILFTSSLIENSVLNKVFKFFEVKIMTEEYDYSCSSVLYFGKLEKLSSTVLNEFYLGCIGKFILKIFLQTSLWFISGVTL